MAVAPRSNASHDANFEPTLIGVSTADGTTPVPVEVDPSTGQLQVSSTGGSGASTIADGADVAEGATSDAAVTAGSAGTVSGKLRTISSDISSLKTIASTLALDATLTGGTQQTKVTDGTNTVNVLKSDGTSAGQNAQLISGTGMTTATLTLSSGTPNTVWYDMLNYPWVSVEILTNTTPATLTFQTSGDSSQTNVRNMRLTDSQSSITSAASLAVTSTTSANATFEGPRTGRYFRISSNNGAGTTTLVITFYTTSIAPSLVSANVNANSATGSAVPANAFMIGISDGTNLVAVRQASNGFNASAGGAILSNIVAQFDDVSPTTITENNFGNIRISSNRNIYTTLRDAAGNERGANIDGNNRLTIADLSAPAGTALNTYSVHLTTNTTTTPTASTAYISSITLSSVSVGTTSTLTIQDKQATPLKLVNGFSTVAVTTTPTVINFQAPVKMTSGIDIITAGSGAATVDVWINYYQ